MGKILPAGLAVLRGEDVIALCRTKPAARRRARQEPGLRYVEVFWDSALTERP